MWINIYYVFMRAKVQSYPLGTRAHKTYENGNSVTCMFTISNYYDFEQAWNFMFVPVNNILLVA
jgi:hypothetical protein